MTNYCSLKPDETRLLTSDEEQHMHVYTWSHGDATLKY